MQDKLVEQTDRPPIKQNAEPTAPPVQVPNNPPNVQPQPVIQVQPYYAQPVYYAPQYLTPNNPSIKERLCCPRVWTWIMFSIHICLVIFGFFFLGGYSGSGIIGVIFYFFVAYNVTKSSNTGDVDKYKTAFKIYIVYFIIESFAYFGLLVGYFLAVYLFGVIFKQYFIIIFFSFIGFTVVIEIITLFILCKYKNVFDRLSFIQQSLPPQL